MEIEKVTAAGGNTSGQGEKAVVPASVSSQFNWGVFLLGWIWGLGNKVYLPLICILIAFIPIAGPIVCFGLGIWFGIKGNEWAWRNKHFESEAAFHENQKLWVKIGLGVYALIFILSFAFGGLIFSALLGASGVKI